MSSCIGGGAKNSIQSNFVKKFENILSHNSSEKIKNPLFQYSHGFENSVPAGLLERVRPSNASSRTLKTIKFPNFRKKIVKKKKKRKINKKGGQKRPQKPDEKSLRKVVKKGS